MIEIERRPCSSCPYRRDTPPGVWHETEYRKLAEYDRPMDEQPHQVFLCHHSELAEEHEVMCRGWIDTHKDTLALRLAIAFQLVSGNAACKALDESPALPVYSSGTEAMEAGIADVDDRAQAVIDRLVRQHPRLNKEEGPDQ